jgi:hypothetical protein
METRRYAGIVFFIMAVGMLAAPVAASADKTAEVGRHGSFVAYTNGVVADTRTGLEWIAGPDVDTSFHQAVAWVRGLTVAGGGWRMPTAVELRTLYRTPGKPSSITPLLKNRGIHVWPHQENEDLSLYLFRYMDPYGTRGFAVRSAGDD